MSRLLLTVAVLAAAVAGLSAPPQPPADGLTRGVRFLLAQQSPDGAWRSDVYAQFKDDTALTPLVLTALQDAAPFADTTAARKKASAWVAKFARPDGTIDEGPDGLPYPVYTAALSVIALSHPENRDHLTARDAWLKYLLARQLTEANGWSPADVHYGGWGYYPGVPKKPAAGQAVPAQHLLESNLSATAFALDALDAAGALTEDVRKSAAVCLRRLMTGGVHLVVGDPLRNKAGFVIDADGRVTYREYGSVLVDAERAAARLGLPWNRPAEVFTFDRHPGDYPPEREANRDAVYYYFARSAAKTLGRRAAKLPDALLAKQRADGSWSNPVVLVRENDPVLATAYAVSALAECRRVRE
ncbi:MAG: prenyltransferase/squalene oxidase repeat-containing protein [Gemmataceae bacterium]